MTSLALPLSMLQVSKDMKDMKKSIGLVGASVDHILALIKLQQQGE
jgi:hypothetical protein